MPDSQQEGNAPGENAASSIRRKDTVDVRLELKALDFRDNKLIRDWRNDYKIWQWCRQNDVISDVEQEEWFRKQAVDPTIAMYKIIQTVISGPDKGSSSAIGVCGFTSIDRWHRRAEFSFYIAAPFHGRGFGQLGMELLLIHGFTNHGFHQIWGEVFQGNPALPLFLDLGFETNGIRPDFYWKDGKFIDATMISITGEKWRNLRLS